MGHSVVLIAANAIFREGCVTAVGGSPLPFNGVRGYNPRNFFLELKMLVVSKLYGISTPL